MKVASLWCKVVIFHKVFHFSTKTKMREEGFRMFLGEYRPTVDAKGRFFMPAKYRDELGNAFVITKGTDSCLSVYPLSYWETYVQKIEALPVAQAVKIRRFVFANACDVEPDAQGRVLLSADLRAYAGIGKNAVVLGLGSYLEIWSEDEWAKQNGTDDAAEVQSLMLSLGF